MTHKDPTIKHRLCVYADVYGFSALVGSDLSGTVDRLSQLQQEIRSICDEVNPPIQSLMVSDSLCFITDFDSSTTNPSMVYDDFQLAISEIYEAALRLKLPLRGCMTFGKIRISEGIVAGRPLIDAVRFEESIRLPLIFFPYSTRKAIEDHFAETDDAPFSLETRLPGPVHVSVADGLVSTYFFALKSTLVSEYAQREYETYRDAGNMPQLVKAWWRVGEILKQIAEQADCR